MKSEKSALGISPEVLQAYLRQNPEVLTSVILSDITEYGVKAADNLPLLPGSQVLVLYEDVCAVYQLDGDRVAGVRFTPFTDFIPDTVIRSIMVVDCGDVARWRTWLLDALRYRKLNREQPSHPGEWWFSWPHRHLLVCFGGTPGELPKVEALRLEQPVTSG